MPYDPLRHHRRSIRMRGHDYGQGGSYFVTICAHDRLRHFGEVVDATMRPSDAGAMVETTWMEAVTVCSGIVSHAFQLMPNHVHGLLVIAGVVDPGPPSSTPLPDFVRRFKNMSMRRYAHGVRLHGWPRFREHLWQRGYHEHLIRSDSERERVVRYIAANPDNWTSDPENPESCPERVR